mgnify:CR=1 FL=1
MQRRKEKYYTTGEFARFFGIKKDTLFYYDRIGLFHPEGVAGNGYRYYSDAQINSFSTLLSLREMGVPLREIQEYFRNPSPDRLLGMASDKIEKIDREIRRLREIRQLFTVLAENMREADEAVPGQVEICRLPDRWFRYSEQLTLDAGTATDEQWGDAYERFAKQTGAAGTVSIGCVLARENLESGKYGMVDRLFMPCEPGVGEKCPGGDYAVLYYKGSYDQMAEAYRILNRELQKRHLRAASGAYEEYLVADLAARNREEFITKIFVKVT